MTEHEPSPADLPYVVGVGASAFVLGGRKPQEKPDQNETASTGDKETPA